MSTHTHMQNFLLSALSHSRTLLLPSRSSAFRLRFKLYSLRKKLLTSTPTLANIEIRLRAVDPEDKEGQTILEASPIGSEFDSIFIEQSPDVEAKTIEAKTVPTPPDTSTLTPEQIIAIADATAARSAAGTLAPPEEQK